MTLTDASKIPGGFPRRKQPESPRKLPGEPPRNDRMRGARRFQIVIARSEANAGDPQSCILRQRWCLARSFDSRLFPARRENPPGYCCRRGSMSLAIVKNHRSVRTKAEPVCGSLSWTSHSTSSSIQTPSFSFNSAGAVSGLTPSSTRSVIEGAIRRFGAATAAMISRRPLTAATVLGTHAQVNGDVPFSRLTADLFQCRNKRFARLLGGVIVFRYPVE